MRLIVCCATERGRRVLERILDLRPRDDILVISFRETPHEPPYFDALRSLAISRGALFAEARAVNCQLIDEHWGEGACVSAFLAVSWRYMVPMTVAQRTAHGGFILHDSLLPAYRGFSPTVWAIANGEPATGATLCLMADDVDSGDIVGQVSVPISRTDRIGDVMPRVTGAYVDLVGTHLDAVLSGTAPTRPQDHDAATYTCKRTLQDNRIIWEGSTQDAYNLIRAVSSPYPGAYTTIDGRIMRVWSASVAERSRRYAGRIPGRVVDVVRGRGIIVLTGDGELMIERVQMPGEEAECAAGVVKTLSTRLGS